MNIQSNKYNLDILWYIFNFFILLLHILYWSLYNVTHTRYDKSAVINIAYTIWLYGASHYWLSNHVWLTSSKQFYYNSVNSHYNMQGCLWGASGMEGSSEYQSMIVYHHNSPCWGETIRLTVPIEKYYGAHVRLEYKHCSSMYCLYCNFRLFMLYVISMVL